MLHKKTIFIIVSSLVFLIIFIILLSLIFSSNNNNVIILPLQSTISINDLTSLFFTNLRTTITISDKKQEVDLFLLSQDFSFFITQQDIFFNNNDNSKINKLSNNFYNYELSSSIKILSNRTKMAFTKYKFGRKATENFSLCDKENCDKKSVNLNNFNFMLVEDPEDKVSGGIGLGAHGYTEYDEINLFNELYRKKYIKNLVWFIEYDENKEEKKLVIGKFPYEVNSKYDKDDFEFFNLNNKGISWQIDVTKITIGENNEDNDEYIIKDRTIQFQQDYSWIYGPPKYYKKIKELFFNKYLSNQCSENTINYQLTEYLYISCNEEISLEDFPPLIIDVNNNLKFELTYEDLFMKSNGKMLFLFISNKIERYFNEKWYFGEPFLKKYTPVYNKKENQIGFYGLIKKRTSSYKSAGIIGFIFLFISIGIITYLCLYIFRKYRNKRIRKAAREMKIEEISSKLILNKNENKSNNE